jgi:hypothetical protein
MLKYLMMLFRNTVVFGLLYLWLALDMTGAGRVVSFYIVGVCLLTLVVVFIPIKPEKALAAKLSGRIMRWIEVLLQWIVLAILVWFGHAALAIFWTILCLGCALIRINLIAAKKKAQKEWMDRDAAEIVAAFGAMNQQSPPANPA